MKPKMFKILIVYNRNAVYVECENRSGTNNSTCNWNHAENICKTYLKRHDANSYRKR